MDIARYLTIPWRDGGRDVSGCDCWGLVRLILGEHGVDVPSYGPISALDRDAVQVAIASDSPLPPWQCEVRPADARPLDVVVMRGPDGMPTHVGLVVPGGRVIHVHAGRAPVAVPLDGPVRRRIVSIHRHEALV